MNYRDMGMRIRTIRRQRGLTQEELAEQVGISASFLGHLERGTRVAGLETLVTLCNTLDVNPDYLLSASLDSLTGHMPQGLSPQEQEQLTHILRLAEDTVALCGRCADIKVVLTKLLFTYGHPDCTNLFQNIGITLAALLLGELDIIRTGMLALNCGFDTDCTCATAGAVVGLLQKNKDR